MQLHRNIAKSAVEIPQFIFSSVEFPSKSMQRAITRKDCISGPGVREQWDCTKCAV